MAFETAPAAPRRVLQRLGGQSVAYALASLAGPGTGLLLLPVYTRYLDPAEFGLLALIEVIALVLTTLFSVGMPALVPFLYVDERDPQERRAGFGTLIIAVTAVNLVLAAVVWVVAPFVAAVLLPSLPFWPYVPLVVVTAALDPYWTMATASLQIQEQAAHAALWSTARVFVSIALRLALVVAAARGAAGYAAANLAAAVLFVAPAAWILRREVRLAFRPAIVRRALALGGPTVPNNLLSYGFRLLDRVVLERVATLEQIGLYYLAVRLVDALRIAGDVLVNAWRPIFFKEGDTEGFARDEMPRVIRLAAVALAGLFVLTAVFAPEAVWVFAAPEFAGAAALVPLLAAAMTLKGLQSFPYLVVWFRRKTAWVPAFSAATLLVAVGANWILAPRLGPSGVALALVLAYTFLTGAMVVASRRLYPVVYPWRQVASAAVLAVITVTAALLVPVGVAGLAVRVVLVVAFAAALVVAGCVPLSELRAVRAAGSRLMPPREMSLS